MIMELLNPLVEYPSYNVAYTGTAGSTTAWNPGPEGVVVWSTTAAYVRVGEGVTATTSDTPIPANTPIPFIVPEGTGAPWRVSAIQVSTGGTVYAKPINKN
jgi:hypothetical protein